MSTPTILREPLRLIRPLLAGAVCLSALTGGLAAQTEDETRVERRVQVVFSDDGEGVEEKTIWVDGDEAAGSIFVQGGEGGLSIAAPILIHTSAYLGVHLLDITPELREHFGATAGAGVLVSAIAEDSPAAAAGIQVGDVLTTIDGEEVASTNQVLRKVSQREEGDSVAVDLVRARRSLALEATLASRPRSQVDLAPMFWSPADGERRVLRLPKRIVEIEGGDLDEAFSELHQRLESPQWREKLEETTNLRLSLETRIQELEERLREMEKRLEEKPR